MIMVHIVTGAAAVAALFGYICRLDLLRFGTHRPSVVLMHIGLAGASAFGLYHACQGTTDLQDVCSVLGAAMWLAVSAQSWPNGVPAHFALQRLRVVGGGEPERAVVRIKP